MMTTDIELFTRACAEYDIGVVAAGEMTEAERDEIVDLYWRQCNPDTGPDDGYYGSIQHADDDPYGYHLMFDVL